MTQQPTALHPLVARYLDDLGRLLAGVDPADRAEVLEGVREHLDASLEGTSRTEADVRAALDELGPPQAVADEAYAGRSPVAAYPVPASVPSTSRGWLPVVVAALEGLSLLAVLALASGGSAVTTVSSSSSRAGDPHSATVSHTTFEGSIGSGFLGLLGALPFWLVLLALVSLTALWTGREKATLLLLMPLAALAFGVLPEVGYGVLGINGVYVGAWISLAWTLVGCTVIVGVLVRRAAARSGALTRT
jgi:hypothetical protein